MLEHVPDPSSIIKACSTLVKADKPDSSKCSLATSKPASAISIPVTIATSRARDSNAKSYLFAIIGAEYILKLLPQGTHDWDKFIKPSEMDEWARHSAHVLAFLGRLQYQRLERYLWQNFRQGFGMTYNPFTKTYKLESDVSVNYLCFYQK
jgi:2-polyprenyl-6-hydroxyphenyl methylase/3-demethylubiquinone-9 3-methyltransferase